VCVLSLPQVPVGYMWVKGDAPASREYGLLPMAMLQGRVIAQVGFSSASMAGIWHVV
jgi:hypothetical protein